MESINGVLSNPTKRLRLPAGGWVAGGGTPEGENVAITLPPEVWAAVMDHLDYSDVLSCAATSRPLLHDAMPLVKSLHIENAAQMNAVTSRRMRDVQEINIFSLFRQEDDEIAMVDQTTVERCSLFIPSFNKLERVFFRGRDLDGGVTTLQQILEDDVTSREFDERIQSLINQISEGYSSSFFSDGVHVFGLMCPYYSRDNNNRCQHCIHACKTWPLEHVLNFETKGSSIGRDDELTYQRPCGLDVCISRIEVESILKQRPGGDTLLHSETRLFHLLGQGTLSIIRCDGGEPLYIVAFFSGIAGEIVRVITSSGVDALGLARSDVNAAIMRSFTKRDSRLPPRNLCYALMCTELRNAVGLNVGNDDFNRPAIDNGKSLLPQIFQGLQSDTDMSDNCILLFDRILFESREPPIQRAIDLGLVPLLIDSMKLGNDSTSKAMKFWSSAIARIVGHGTIAQVQIFITAGILPVLVNAIDSECQDVAFNASSAIVEICRKSAQFRDCVLNAGVIAPLIRVIEKWEDDMDILVHTSLTLVNLCGGRPRPEFALVTPCLKPFLNLLISNEVEKVLVNVCLGLSLLFDRPVEHIEVDLDAEVHTRLAGLFLHSSLKVRIEALRLVAAIFRKDRSSIKILASDNRDSGALPNVVSFLKSTKSWHQKCACLVVNAVIQDKIDSIPIFLNHGCIDQLCGVLLLDDTAAINNGLFALKSILEFVRNNPNQKTNKDFANDIELIETKIMELETKWKGEMQ